MIFVNDFAQSVMFISLLSGASWLLTNIYVPCTDEGKRQFITWFKNIQMPDNVDWLVVGDFNFIRKAEDRNKPGANINEILMFNEAISSLDPVEIPLKGRTFTWDQQTRLPSSGKIRLVFFLPLLDFKLPQHSSHIFGYAIFWSCAMYYPY